MWIGSLSFCRCLDQRAFLVLPCLSLSFMCRGCILCRLYERLVSISLFQLLETREADATGLILRQFYLFLHFRVFSYVSLLKLSRLCLGIVCVHSIGAQRTDESCQLTQYTQICCVSLLLFHLSFLLFTVLPNMDNVAHLVFFLLVAHLLGRFLCRFLVVSVTPCLLLPLRLLTVVVKSMLLSLFVALSVLSVPGEWMYAGFAESCLLTLSMGASTYAQMMRAVLARGGRQVGDINDGPDRGTFVRFFFGRAYIDSQLWSEYAAKLWDIRNNEDPQELRETLLPGLMEWDEVSATVCQLLRLCRIDL